MPQEVPNEYGKKLEEIAQKYHDGHLNDMWIEKAGQDFEWPWIESQIQDNSRVLDLGYGDGHSFFNLQGISVEKNLRVTLVEGAPTLVQIAEEKAKDRMEVVHDYFETYGTRKDFDLIIASHVLEHVDSPIELLKHLASLMSPDGKMVGIVPNRESIHRRLAVSMGIQPALDTLSPRDILVGHQRVYSSETLRADFLAAGWSVTELKGYFLKPFSNSQLIPLGEKVIQSLLEISPELPAEFCANLGFVARPRETQ
jgi:2-polyprenyl-3-methyl-5-hydroxy-6-metoxy-1,4-benzoquinol methylase